MRTDECRHRCTAVCPEVGDGVDGDEAPRVIRSLLQIIGKRGNRYLGRKPQPAKCLNGLSGQALVGIKGTTSKNGDELPQAGVLMTAPADVGHDYLPVREARVLQRGPEGRQTITANAYERANGEPYTNRR